jgi:hypothetical protein
VNGRRSERLRGEGYCCSPADRLLSINIRHASDSALDDYARYLVCALGAIVDGTLGEMARFEIDTRARRRFFQLAAMLERLVTRVVLAPGAVPACVPRLAFRVDQPDEFQQFYDGVTSTAATPEERQLRDAVVVPWIAKLLGATRGDPYAQSPDVRLAVKDFFSDRMLSVDLGGAVSAALVGEVIASFRAFGQGEGA